MNDAIRREDLQRIFADLANELDVPPSKYEEAKERYDAVGEWLNEEQTALAPYEPRIYPQGSFALGTAIKPLGEEEYDVDAVCCLRTTKREVTQKQLKDMVGQRLKEHGTYARMLDPREGGRRCWTLKYADSSKFHLDILPAIPDPCDWLLALGVSKAYAQHAISITDKTTWNTAADWPKSNPQGYVEWFKTRMRVILEERRRLVALEKRAEVQDVPDYEVRTPLQRVIQLLKRHRDVRYNGDDDKPISIIITTLAARAYNNEADLVTAILNVVPGMARSIENRNGVYWIMNPVNPKENFADKWVEKPRKAEVFFEWLRAVEREHQSLLTPIGFDKVGEYIEESYGRREAAVVMEKHAGASRTQGRPSSGASLVASSQSRSLSRFAVSHREAPHWPMRRVGAVRIRGRIKSNGQWHEFGSDCSGLPKGYDLLFQASTDVQPPFSVHWQVVNTGREAASKNQLRGQIIPSATAGVGGLTQKEATAYTGMHWIQCFIVKNGVCMAASDEFVVNIA
jgi:hypothetical protein